MSDVKATGGHSQKLSGSPQRNTNIGEQATRVSNQQIIEMLRSDSAAIFDVGLTHLLNKYSLLLERMFWNKVKPEDMGELLNTTFGDLVRACLRPTPPQAQFLWSFLQTTARHNVAKIWRRRLHSTESLDSMASYEVEQLLMVDLQLDKLVADQEFLAEILSTMTRADAVMFRMVAEGLSFETIAMTLSEMDLLTEIQAKPWTNPAKALESRCRRLQKRYCKLYPTRGIGQCSAKR